VELVNCTLTILDDKKISIEYEDKGKIYSVEGELGSDPIAELTVERLNWWVNFGLKQQEANQGKGNPVTAGDLEVIGLNLYRILFGDKKIRDKFTSVYKQFESDYKERADQGEDLLRLRLRLVFYNSSEALGRLPWEFLFIPGEEKLEQGFFFAGERTDLILTRYVPESELVKKLKAAPEKLRVLLAISRPSGEGDITEDVKTQLLTQISEIKKAEVKVIDDKDCTYDEVETTLQEWTPHIFHFVGHGKEGQLALVKKKTDGDWDERDPDSLQPRWITSKQLGKLFTNCHPRPRLVFLHACKGAAATSHEALNSCARELVYADIPAVVAMQYSISNQDAGLFAKTFYEELGHGHGIDEAVKAGRLALGKVWPRWEHPRFGTPVVYLQTDSPIVLPLSNDEEPLKEEKEPSAVAGLSRVGSSAVVPTTTQKPEPSAPASAFRREQDSTKFGG
jgi:hypothetical protein